MKSHLPCKFIKYPYILLLCSILVLSVIPINGHNIDSLQGHNEKLINLPESIKAQMANLGKPISQMAGSLHICMVVQIILRLLNIVKMIQVHLM